MNLQSGKKDVTSVSMLFIMASLYCLHSASKLASERGNSVCRILMVFSELMII